MIPHNTVAVEAKSVTCDEAGRLLLTVEYRGISFDQSTSSSDWLARMDCGGRSSLMPSGLSNEIFNRLCMAQLSLSRCLVGSSGNGAKQFNQTDPFPNGVRAATASMMWRMVPDLSAAHVLSYPFSASSDVCPMRPIPQMDPPFPSSYSAR